MNKGEGMEQEQMTVPAGYIDRVTDQISDNAILVGLLLLAGMVVGVATTQLVKLGMRVFKGEPATPAIKIQRALLYRFCGTAAGFCWTFFLIWEVVGGRGILAVASGGALVAGGFTPTLYDLWCNRLKPWIGAWFTKKGAPPGDGGDDEPPGGDSTHTSFKP